MRVFTVYLSKTKEFIIQQRQEFFMRDRTTIWLYEYSVKKGEYQRGTVGAQYSESWIISFERLDIFVFQGNPT